jgi:hypothetical protein
VSARTQPRPRGQQTASVEDGKGGEGKEGEAREGEGRQGRRREGGGERWEARRGTNASVRTRPSVRADAHILSPCNFIMDATMCLSHGQPSGHRSIVHPSVIVHVTTMFKKLSLGLR